MSSSLTFPHLYNQVRRNSARVASYQSYFIKAG